MKDERRKLGLKIKDCLEEMRLKQGWTIDDLANYLEINSLTLRNALHTCAWSDMAVTILKLKKTIPEELAFSYKKAMEREKIEKRKGG